MMIMEHWRLQNWNELLLFVFVLLASYRISIFGISCLSNMNVKMKLFGAKLLYNLNEHFVLLADTILASIKKENCDYIM